MWSSISVRLWSFTLMVLLHTSGYSQQPSCYENCIGNYIRNKTFLFVKIETSNFINFVKPHKISSIYLDKQKSFVLRIAQFHCNWIAMKLCNSCNFFINKLSKNSVLNQHEFENQIFHLLGRTILCILYTVKLGNMERFDKKQIGIKEPFPVTNLPFTS